MSKLPPGYYSQYDGALDLAIERVLQPGAIGRFIDIGAADGRTFSNSRRLAETYGWEGVVVEPQPNCLIGLTALYADNPRVHVVNAALSPSEELIEFHDDGGGMVATLDPEHRRLWETAASYRRTYVAPISWAKLLRKFPGPFDFVTIDVEGNNYSVFTTMPLETIRPRLVVVEYSPCTIDADRKEVPIDERDRMIRHAAGFGYGVLDDIQCNLFLAPHA